MIQEAWIGGVSTRKVDDPVLDVLDGPLAGEWPCLWPDATYLKIREGGRIVSVAAMFAVAVNTHRRREINGLCVRPRRQKPSGPSFRAVSRALASTG